MSTDQGMPRIVLDLRGGFWAFDSQAIVDDCRAHTPVAEVAEHAAALLGMQECDVELRRQGTSIVVHVRGGRASAIIKP